MFPEERPDGGGVLSVPIQCVAVRPAPPRPLPLAPSPHYFPPQCAGANSPEGQGFCQAGFSVDFLKVGGPVPARSRGARALKGSRMCVSCRWTSEWWWEDPEASTGKVPADAFPLSSFRLSPLSPGGGVFELQPGGHPFSWPAGWRRRKKKTLSFAHARHMTLGKKKKKNGSCCFLVQPAKGKLRAHCLRFASR